MDEERDGLRSGRRTNNGVCIAETTMISQPQASVIINIPPLSPRSPRLAHLRPPSPLTPEAMRRIHQLTVQEGPVDSSKLSPISPLYPTSDLGSSPRSSISVTTSSSSTWSAYRENKKSSSDFTDADSDYCKDLFSPSIMLSPAPFSPFSDHPDSAETPAFSDPTTTPMYQRLRFSFDPKSPSFLPLAPSRSSHFLLPPTPALVVRERSRSDGDTATVLDSSNDEISSASTGQEQSAASGTVGNAASSSSVSSKSSSRRQVEGHKHLYKKRLLRKYNEETSADTISTSLANEKMDESGSGGVTSAVTMATPVCTIVTVSSPDDEATAPKNGRSEQRPPTCLPTIITHHEPPSSATSLLASTPVITPSPSAPVSPTNLYAPASLGLMSSASTSQIGTASQSLADSNLSTSASHVVSRSPDSDPVSMRSSIGSASLPLIRVGAPNLSTQPYFGLWLKQQLLAVNSLWYNHEQHATTTTNVSQSSSAGVSTQQRFQHLFGSFPNAAAAAAADVCSPPHYQQLPSKQTASGMDATPSTKICSPPVVALDSKSNLRARHRANAAAPSAAALAPASVGPMKSRRSRSESDVSYVCQHCGQSFSLHDRLAKHVASRHRDRSNSRESPLRSHKCTVCHKAFGRSDMLTRHMRLHTGIKPYACRVCGQVFSRSDHLSTHHRTHTGEKPYQCPQCPYAASRRDMITRHMRTHSRTSYGEHSASPSSSSSSSSAALASGGTYEDASSGNIGYVSVIRRALDHTLLADRQPRDDTDGTGSQLETPRLSADSSGRASTGSASTVLCVEDDEEMMCQSTEVEPDVKIRPQPLSPVCKSPGSESARSTVLRETHSSNIVSLSPSSRVSTSSPRSSPSSVKTHSPNGDESAIRREDVCQGEMTVKIEPSS